MIEEESILENLRSGVIEYDEDKITTNAEEAISTGIDINKAITAGLTEGMRIVGDLYEKEEYSIPEVLLCSDALEKGMNILKPHLKKESLKKEYCVCIGTVEGDIHSIGKNMVKLMFEVGGYRVIDLGEDVSPKKIINVLRKEKIDVVALSTMMTPTLRNMKQSIDVVRENNFEVKIIVGGASVTEKTANSFNVDGYAESAQEAIKVMQNIIENN